MTGFAVFKCGAVRALALFLSVASISSALSGCGAVAVGSAVVATTTLARQDRGIEQSVSDVKLTMKLSQVIYDQGLSGYVKVRVYEGRAVLVGIVKSEDVKSRIEKLVSEVDGVTSVDNGIRVDPNNREKLSDEVADLAITSAIKAKLIVDPGVRYGNYTVITIDKVVYLIGIYRDKDELDRVLSIAENTSGVQEVVSYLDPSKSSTDK